MRGVRVDRKFLLANAYGAKLQVLLNLVSRAVWTRPLIRKEYKLPGYFLANP